MTYWPVVVGGLIVLFVLIGTDRMRKKPQLVLFRIKSLSENRKLWRTDLFQRKTRRLLDAMNCTKDERRSIDKLMEKLKSDLDLNEEELAAIELIDAKVSVENLSKAIHWINILGWCSIIAILGRLLLALIR